MSTSPTYTIYITNNYGSNSDNTTSSKSKASTQSKDSSTGIAPAPSSDGDSFASSISLGSPVAANEHARFWGDPHIVGGDGEKYDMQEPGTWNLLSDKDVNLNAKTARASQDPNSPTYTKEVGLTVGDNQVKINVDGTASITSGGNTANITEDGVYQLSNGSYLKKDGDKILVETPEYKMNFDTNLKDGGRDGTEHIDVDVASKDCGVALDGQKPTGILGETFDAGSDKQTGLKNDTSDYARQGLYDTGSTQAADGSGSASQSQSTSNTQSYGDTGNANQSQSTGSTQSSDGTGSASQSQSTDNTQSSNGTGNTSQSTSNAQSGNNSVQQIVQILQNLVKLIMQMIQQLQGGAAQQQ